MDAAATAAAACKFVDGARSSELEEGDTQGFGMALGDADVP